jgi:endonuclease/exonuclease/phosphatase family metal-dependent hydrolase
MKRTLFLVTLIATSLISQKVLAGEFSLKMMSYNIHGMILIKNDHDRYAEIGRRLKELRGKGEAPQIVAIQEGFHRRTRELIQEAGYPFVLRGPRGHAMKPLRSGLILMSEFPIRAKHQTVFEDCGNIDCLASKGVVRVLVDIPGVPFPIEILDTHMQAVYKRGRTAPSRVWKIHRSQINQLADFMQWMDLEDSENRAGVQFFMGDFNFRKSRDPWTYQFMEETTGFVDAARNCFENSQSGGECRVDEIRANDWETAIDHVYVRQNAFTHPQVQVRPLRVERGFRDLWRGKKLSDHLSVESEFLLQW